MGKSLLIHKIFALGTRRISKDANRFTFDPSRVEVPAGDFEDLHEPILKGLFRTELGFSGATSSALEKSMLQKLVDDAATVPATLFLGDGSPGSLAFFLETHLSAFRWTGERGALAGFETVLRPQSHAYLGQVLFNSVGTPGIEGPTAGGGLELGPLGPGQELLVSYHPVDPPGAVGTNPTLDGFLQSNVDDLSWDTTATDRLALPQIDSGGGFRAHLLRIDGDTTLVTDTWWRVAFTAVGGTDNPSFFVLMAITLRNK